MKEQTHKNISALVDDELDLSELQHLTRDLADSEELRRLWGRYQLIGDVIRGERFDPRFLEVAQRVHDRLAGEPTILAPRPASEGRGTWLKPVAGLAVAASVAAAVVMLTPRLPDQNLPASSAVAGVDSTEPVAYPLRTGTHWDLGKPAVESKLNTYLVNHHRHAPAANMQGMLEYASFVGYDGGQ